MSESESVPAPAEGLLRPEAPPKTLEERAELLAKIREKLEGILGTLTERERKIIKLRYGLGDGYTYTLEEVGKTFKVTREPSDRSEDSA